MLLVLRRPIGDTKREKRVLDSDNEDEGPIAHGRRSQDTSRAGGRKRSALLFISYLISH